MVSPSAEPYPIISVSRLGAANCSRDSNLELHWILYSVVSPSEVYPPIRLLNMLRTPGCSSFAGDNVLVFQWYFLLPVYDSFVLSL